MAHLDPQGCGLLRAIARSAAADDQEALARLAGKVEDWDGVIQGARRHGVLPMLYSRLATNGIPVPASALQLMKAESDRSIFHNMANAAELLNVLRAFEEEEIAAMPFKGVVLAASVYPSPTMRPAGDLDILIFFKDLKRATTALTKRGYKLTTPLVDDAAPPPRDQYEYHFERHTDGMVIELRWRLELTKPRFRRNLGMDWIWPRRQITTLAGARVPDLDPAAALLVLCMHGSKHAWSRLIWTCDVARLLEKHPDLKWDDVIQQAKSSGLWRTLALGSLLANRIAGAPLPQEVRRGFEADRAVLNLARHFDENLIREPGSIPKSRVPYNVQLLGFSDRIRMVISPRFLRPSARDLAVVKLPQVLHPLYYVIRPIRILLGRSGR